MSELEDALEYDHLKAFAWNLGFHAEVHKHFNPLLSRPGREKAFWYLMRSKKQNPEAAPHEPSILRYALASEIYDWLLEFKRTESPGV